MRRALNPRTLAPNQAADWRESRGYFPSEIQVEGTSWARPADWLPLPAAGVNSFRGLFAVWDTGGGGSNYVALSASGNYTVNWGDGSAVENIASGATAYHRYTYSALGAETVCSRGYKQAIVTVTMQSGQTLTWLSLNKLHNRTGLVSGGYSAAWLDISINAPSMTSLEITNTPAGVCIVKTGLLERVNVLASALTDTSYLFYNCYSLVTASFLNNTATVTTTYQMFRGCFGLQFVTLFDTSAVTNMDYMFGSCYSLRYAPPMNTSSATSMANMFSSCHALQSVPPYNTSNVLSMASMFPNCYSLESVPKFDTSKVTAMNSMFTSCYQLRVVPFFNTPAVTTMASMFSGCNNLEVVPLFDTSAVTSMSAMFSSCYNLTSVPLFNTALVTTMSQMFGSCYSLQSVPLFNTVKVTTMNSMFINCYNLQVVPLFNTAAVTDMGSMFSSCTALRIIPAMTAAAVTAALTNIFAACYSVTSMQMTGFKLTFTLSSCALGANELNAVYTGLASGVSGQTITVTNNPGIDADNPAIATAKGWTVTGS